MQISELKSRISITDVASHLGIVVNAKTKRANCPFHDDKTPSLQFSEEKQICTCFSSNCDAGSMDIINLTEKKLQISTHEAIKYLEKHFINGVLVETHDRASHVIAPPKDKIDYQKDFDQMQSSFLSSSTARKYAESRSLGWKQLHIGYNALKSSKFNYLRGCIAFGLKDKNGKIVSLYGRSVRDAKHCVSTGKHFYTPNRQGLYPKYPTAETTKLILTESVIDAATLLSIPEITNDYEVLALYGTNGLTAEHSEAIKQLENLKEIILFFDGDEAGRAATIKTAEKLLRLLSGAEVTVVHTPDNEDTNSLAVAGETKTITKLIKNRKPFDFAQDKTFSRPSVEDKLSFSKETSSEKEKAAAVQTQYIASRLDTTNPNKIIYPTTNAIYYVKGGIPKALDSMRVTLEIENLTTGRKSRLKLDLYEDKQTEKAAREAGEKLNLRADLIEMDLSQLTDLLDKYREDQILREEEKFNPKTVCVANRERYVEFGRKENLMQEINDLIGKSGIVGEENNRLFLFACACSHKMRKTLHVVVQGSSGSGKTHTIKKISEIMPQEKVKNFTRVSDKSFYNYGEYDLCNTLIVLEDYDGMGEEAELAWRELQSNEKLVSSVSQKDDTKNEIRSGEKIVRGPIASMVATTRGEIYQDNESRVFFIAIDESEEQTQKIIDYKNEVANGEISHNDQEKARTFLQNFVRTLEPKQVRNPWLKHINLPVHNEQKRRLHGLFESFCEQITLIHQHQRKTDEMGRLLSEKQDVQIAINLMFESIVLKVDELDGALRNFYERLKKYVKQRGEKYEFTRLEIRQALKISKTQQHSYFNTLLELEYIYQSGGYPNRGYKYRINYWDDNQRLRDRIKTDLENQLQKL